MYYHNLGGTLGDDLRGNQGLIQNIQFGHLSGTELASDSGFAWVFLFGSGTQNFGNKLSTNATWAVRPGDVLSVPEPAMALLLGGGLVVLGLKRRRARARPG